MSSQRANAALGLTTDIHSVLSTRAQGKILHGVMSNTASMNCGQNKQNKVSVKDAHLVPSKLVQLGSQLHQQAKSADSSCLTTSFCTLHLLCLALSD